MLIFVTLCILALSFDCTTQQIVEEEQTPNNVQLNDPFNDYEWLPQFKESYGNQCEAAKYSSGNGRCIYILDPKSFMIGKLELLSFDPLVVMFHSVLSDIYIDEILDVTRNKLVPGIIRNFSRVAEDAWLDENSAVDRYITRLYTELTGIGLSHAGLVNVVKYKPGGHLAPHLDFYDPDQELRAKSRFATLLTVLHEPKHGGHTIFPHLDLSIKLTKGSMLLWFNVLPVGGMDPRVLHGGCPIWEGIKIIGQIPVGSGGNELAIRCQSKSAFEPSSFQHGLIRFMKS